MKFLLTYFSIFLLSFSVFANEGVFGFRKGMTLSQVQRLGLGNVTFHRGNTYFINNPRKPSDVDSISLIIPPNEGLLSVTFFLNIESNPYGDEIKLRFNELYSVLVKKYGKGKKVDTLRSGSSLSKPKDWLKGIKEGDRKLFWYSTQNQKIERKYNLSDVTLGVGHRRNDIFLLMLKYEFKGFSSYEVKEAYGF